MTPWGRLLLITTYRVLTVRMYFIIVKKKKHSSDSIAVELVYQTLMPHLVESFRDI